MQQLSLRRPGKPLGLNDFSFYGCDALLEPIHEQLRRITITDGESQITTVQDAIFVPDAVCAAQGRPSDRGGLVDDDGQPIVAAHGRRGPRCSTPHVPDHEVQEDVLYLGWMFGQYGHFLLETLARVWALPAVDPTVKVLFNLDPKRLPRGIQSRILTEFGIPPDRLLVLDAPTRLRRVIVPEPRYELSHWAHARAGDPFREVAARILVLGGGGEGVSEQPLYLSRRLLASNQRQVIGEGELEDVLRENGFAVAHPETMSFEDQIRLLNRHRDIFAVDGTAAHNIIFAAQKKRLHFLIHDVPQRDYFMTPTIAHTDATYIRCLSSGDRPIPKISMFRVLPQMLEPEPLMTYLQERGFLKKRTRANLLLQNRDHSDRLAEAWMYSRLVIATRTRETLDLPVEQEMREVAASSWIVSIALAWYFSKQRPAEVTAYAHQFARLVTNEMNSERFARYAEDVRRLIPQISAACSSEVAEMLQIGLAERFAASRVTLSEAARGQ